MSSSDGDDDVILQRRTRRRVSGTQPSAAPAGAAGTAQGRVSNTQPSGVPAGTAGTAQKVDAKLSPMKPGVSGRKADAQLPAGQPGAKIGRGNAMAKPDAGSSSSDEEGPVHKRSLGGGRAALPGVAGNVVGSSIQRYCLTRFSSPRTKWGVFWVQK
jgi:hypothetical protein